jgi:hypothetical protein
MTMIKHNSLTVGILALFLLCTMVACFGGQSTIPLHGQNCGVIYLPISPFRSQSTDTDCFVKAAQTCTAATLEYDVINVDVGDRWGMALLPHGTACRVEFTEQHHGNAQNWSGDSVICPSLTIEWRGIVIHCASGLKIFPISAPVSNANTHTTCGDHFIYLVQPQLTSDLHWDEDASVGVQCLANHAKQCTAATATITIKELTPYSRVPQKSIGSARHVFTTDGVTCEVADAVSYLDAIHGNYFSYDHTDRCATIERFPTALILHKCEGSQEIDILADAVATLAKGIS